jgi:hypothetical protein
MLRRRIAIPLLVLLVLVILVPINVPLGKEQDNKSSQSLDQKGRIHVEKLLKSVQYNLDQLDQIQASILKLKKGVKPKRARLTLERERYKYCEDYGDLGCGCIQSPPGISFVCGPGDI